MGEAPDLSKGEMVVARLLWQHGPASVRAIHEAQSEAEPMDFSTVQTYLRRLESKGYARSILQGRTRIYSARTKPKTVIRKTVDDLVDRLFGGETMPLVRHLIEENKINAEEIAQLKQLLEQLDPKKKES